jgi:hypothetical protein
LQLFVHSVLVKSCDDSFNLEWYLVACCCSGWILASHVHTVVCHVDARRQEERAIRWTTFASDIIFLSMLFSCTMKAIFKEKGIPDDFFKVTLANQENENFAGETLTTTTPFEVGTTLLLPHRQDVEAVKAARKLLNMCVKTINGIATTSETQTEGTNNWVLCANCEKWRCVTSEQRAKYSNIGVAFRCSDVNRSCSEPRDNTDQDDFALLLGATSAAADSSGAATAVSRNSGVASAPTLSSGAATKKSRLSTSTTSALVSATSGATEPPATSASLPELEFDDDASDPVTSLSGAPQPRPSRCDIELIPVCTIVLRVIFSRFGVIIDR